MNIIDNSALHPHLASGCIVCMQSFQSADRIPNILPCNHVICSSCLNLLLYSQHADAKCPFDLTPIHIQNHNNNSFSVDRIQPLNSFPEQQHYSYPELAPPMIDNSEINQSIASESNIVDQSSMAEEQRPVLGELKAYHDYAHYQLDSQKKTALYLIEDTFREIEQLLNKKEKDVLSDTINYSFYQKSVGDNTFMGDLPYKKELLQKIDHLEGKMYEKFFQALEQEIHPFRAKLGYDALDIHNKNLTDTYHQRLERFSGAAFYEATHFKPIFGPTHYISQKQMIQSKLSQVRDIIQFTLEEDWLVISARSYRRDNNNGERMFVESNIKWGEMQKIKLNFDKKALSKAAFRAIYYIWSLIGPVNSIKMELSHPNFGDTELEELAGDSFWASEKLEKFEISLRKCKIKDDTMRILLTGPLMKMPGLKCFVLNLKNTTITDVTIDILNKLTLPNMMGLETFQIYLSGTRVTDRTIVPFCNNAKYALTQVRDLALCLRGKYITIPSFLALTHSFSAFLGLDSLDLSLPGVKIDDPSMEKFSMALALFAPQIVNFSLNLSNTAIKGPSIETLSIYAISKMKLLKNFTLTLSETDVTDSSIKGLFKNMKVQNKPLKSFIVTLNKTKTGDKGIKALAKEILPNIVGLETFTLELYNTLVTDISIEHMCANMKNAMKSVKTFNLGLVNTKITDRSVNAFATSTLSYMEAMESFTLGLLGTKITDSSMTSLCRNMLPITGNIKKFELELGNTVVTDTGLKEITMNILSFTNLLESLTLGLSATKVTDDGVIAVCESIKELKTLVLALGHTTVTDKSISVLAEYLMPKVDRIRKFEINLHNTKVSDSAEGIMSHIRHQISQY